MRKIPLRSARAPLNEKHVLLSPEGNDRNESASPVAGKAERKERETTEEERKDDVQSPRVCPSVRTRGERSAALARAS